MQHQFNPRLRTRLGEYLLAKGLLTEEQLEKSLELQKRKGGFLGEAVAALGFVSPSMLGNCMEDLTTYPYVELSNYSLIAPLEHQVPEQFARQHLAVAFMEGGSEVHVAMVDPRNLGVIDGLHLRLQQKIIPYFALKADVLDAINRVYSVSQKGQTALSELSKESASDHSLSADKLQVLADQAPIVRLVDGIIESAVTSNASDIHIEPQEDQVRVRFRMDGILYQQMTFSRNHLAAVISRIKIMSQLDISERRKPQDGRISIRDERGEFDLRVNIMPLVHGETVVMRVLDRRSLKTQLSDLGMEPDLLQTYRRMIHQPHGILLVTGPTGSGKTTTLYSSLLEISTPEIKVVTVEDPVEYQLPGINQVQVLPKIGVSFADCLRAIVRQDPDVLLIGEIRDRETAEIAIQAALTGHLVLSTLHTNDAPGALIRLQNMGIEPFLLGSTVLGVMAQRLLRTVCPDCKQPITAPPAMIAKFGLHSVDGQPPQLATGAGCSRCFQRGLKGRTAVYEFMPMTDTLRDLTLRATPASQIRVQAVAEGMVTMQEAACQKVVRGITTLDEMARVLFIEDAPQNPASFLRMVA